MSRFRPTCVPGPWPVFILLAVIQLFLHHCRSGRRWSLHAAALLAGLASLAKVTGFFVVILLVLVIGGIVAGYFTATEASAIAVLYTFVLGVLIYREVRLRDLPQILLASASTTAIVMLLIATSMGMSWVSSPTSFEACRQ